LALSIAGKYRAVAIEHADAVPAPVSWMCEVIADSSGQWVSNALRFSTKEEAKTYAKDLFSRWTAVREFRVVGSNDPVNQKKGE
jgi:hypothetical protein